jgi:hypothetical protein
MGQTDLSRTAGRRTGTPAWTVVAVAVLGLAAPLFVSSPLSAADTHGGNGVATTAYHSSTGM